MGRWQVLSKKPKVICDTAHNSEGLKEVLTQVAGEVFDRLFVVLGVVNDKDLNKLLPLFPKDAQYFFCKPDVPRGLDAAELQKAAVKHSLEGEVYSSVGEAYSSALIKANKTDLIYIGGSTFTVAEVL